MKKFKEFIQRPHLQVAYVLSIFLLILLMGFSLMRSGLSLTWDSARVIIAAENFHSGQGLVLDHVPDLVKKDSIPFYTWPPLFPILASCLMYLGMSSSVASSLIPIVCFALLMPVLFLFAKILKCTGGAYLIVAISGTFLPFWKFSTSILSEMPYIFFTVTALLLLTMYARDLLNDKKGILLAGAALFTSFAVLTRYIGLTLIVVGAFVIFYTNWRKWPRMFFHLILFGAIGGVPIRFWMYRNEILMGRSTPVPERVFKFNHFLENGQLSLKIIYKDFLLNPGTVVLTLYILMFLAFFIFAVKYGQRSLASIAKINIPIFLYTSIYWVGMLMFQSRGKEWHIFDYRYTIPVYPFLIMIFLSFSNHVFQNIKERKIRFVYLGEIFALSLIFLIPQISASHRVYVARKSGGKLDFNYSEWRSSEGIKWVKKHIPKNALIYSGRKTALPLRLWSKRPTRYLEVMPKSSLKNVQKEALYRRLNEIIEKSIEEARESYIIFFKRSLSHWAAAYPENSSYFVEAQTIAKDIPSLPLVANLKDSAIFKVKKGSRP